LDKVLLFSILEYNLKEQHQLYKLRSNFMTNGKATASTTAKPSASVAAQSSEKTISLKAIPEKVEQTPLEKSLQRINKLVELQKKHTRLLLSEQKLDEFRLQKGEENIELELSDEHNRNLEFSTQNPEVVAVVINVLRATIQEKRKEVEAQLLAAA
jgi:hypothetical protein